MARAFSGRGFRDARHAAGLRPEQLAVHLDRSVWTIAAYETGRAVPPLPVLLRAAELLGVDLDDLLTDDVREAAHA